MNIRCTCLFQHDQRVKFLSKYEVGAILLNICFVVRRTINIIVSLYKRREIVSIFKKSI